MNSVYFIGAGPGDPGLLTLKGAAALEKAGVVYVVAPYEETFSHLLVGKQVLIPFDYDFTELVNLIESQLGNCPVAFLIPGDLTFFSPYQGLIDHFATRSVVLAGVGVANAASAHLKRTLDPPSVCNRTLILSTRILDSSEPIQRLENLAAPGVTLIIYMNTLPLPELVKKLRKGYGKDVAIVLVHRLGLSGEKVIEGSLDTIVAACKGVDYFYLNEPDKKPALTLVIVGESLREKADGSWWDQRRERKLMDFQTADER